jgi:hypothetical protein
VPHAPNINEVVDGVERIIYTVEVDSVCSVTKFPVGVTAAPLTLVTARVPKVNPAPGIKLCAVGAVEYVEKGSPNITAPAVPIVPVVIVHETFGAVRTANVITHVPAQAPLESTTYKVFTENAQDDVKVGELVGNVDIVKICPMDIAGFVARVKKVEPDKPLPRFRAITDETGPVIVVLDGIPVSAFTVSTCAKIDVPPQPGVLAPVVDSKDSPMDGCVRLVVGMQVFDAAVATEKPPAFAAAVTGSHMEAWLVSTYVTKIGLSVHDVLKENVVDVGDGELRT